MKRTYFDKQRLVTRAAILALGLSLALTGGCHDGDSGKTNFTGFVLNLIDDTSDTAAPVSINGEDFKFSDDPDQFDELFD
jgi:hypothetical protein